MIEINTITDLEISSPNKMLSEALSLAQRIDYFLLKSGFRLSSMKNLNKDISAVTNNVFFAILTDSKNAEVESIIKVSQDRCEPREITLSDNLGGWNKNKLENESEILELVQKANISSPSPIFYQIFEDGIEMFAETVVKGTKCTDLRIPNVDPVEFGRLEREKGRVLAQIHNISPPLEIFGTLEDEARRFDTWSEYFFAKVTTTLSCLYGMYDKLKGLQYFKDLAIDEHEWRSFLENVARLYSKESIQLLIENDGAPTLSHGDYWDGNLIACQNDGHWDVSVIDFERGGIEGKSFDLSLWLIWKVGGITTNPDPLESSDDFLKGYREAGGAISPEINKYIAIYGLWQYLDFLIMDTVHGIDRTDESVYEINKQKRVLQSI